MILMRAWLDPRIDNLGYNTSYDYKRYHRQSMAGFRGKIRLFRVLSYLRFTFNAGSFVSPSTRSREEEDVRRILFLLEFGG